MINAWLFSVPQGTVSKLLEIDWERISVHDNGWPLSFTNEKVGKLFFWFIECKKLELLLREAEPRMQERFYVQ